MSLGLLCPGQGDQSPAMFDILSKSEPARAVLAACQRAIGQDPRRVAADLLHVNSIAQPLVCALQLAAWEALRAFLPEPRALAGYSVGELAAYGCAGALEPGEVVRLARTRAMAMDAAFAGPGGLVAVRGLPLSRMQRLCAERGVEIAIINDLDRVVIGGPREALDSCASAAAAAAGARVTPLNVAIPSHTSLMRPAAPKFRLALEAADWRVVAAPVMAGISGAPVYARAQAIDVLSLQVAQTVNWAACLEGLKEMGCTCLLELGPGNALSRMARDRFPDLPARSIADFHSLDGVIGWARRQLEA